MNAPLQEQASEVQAVRDVSSAPMASALSTRPRPKSARASKPSARGITVESSAAELPEAEISPPSVESNALLSAFIQSAPTAETTSPSNLAQGDHGSAPQAAPANSTRLNPPHSPYIFGTICAEDVKDEDTVWLWEDVLPFAELVLLAGAAGVGKSSLTTWIAATVGNGSMWPDDTPCVHSGGVLMLGNEDRLSVAKARLRANGAALGTVRFVTISEAELAANPSLLAEIASQTPNLRVIIIDPVTSLLRGSNNNAAAVRVALEWLRDLARKLNCVIVCITHFTKANKRLSALERVSGSKTVTDVPRVVLIAAKGKAGSEFEGKHILVKAKANDAPPDGGFVFELRRDVIDGKRQGQTVNWGEPLEGTADELLAMAEETPKAAGGLSPAVEAACSFLRQRLSAGSATAPEMFSLATSAGISKRTLDRARDHVGVITRKEVHHWVWSLPAPQAPSASADVPPSLASPTAA